MGQVGRGGTVAHDHITATAAENSEVLPLNDVASAVAHAPGAAVGMTTEKFATPIKFVATSMLVRKVRPSASAPSAAESE
jgi:hypothetical protein